MHDDAYLCQQCHQIFRLPVTASPPGKEAACPRCGSTRARGLPAWEPLGADLAGPLPEWEYQCQQCRHTFHRPLPASPTQEKALTCPACGDGHVHRLTPTGGEPLYCG